MTIRTGRAGAWATGAAVLCLVLSIVVAPAAGGQENVVFEGVTPVDTIAVPDGTSLEDALAALPATTTITVSEGDPIPVELDWELRELVETSRGDNIVRQVWYPTARGTYEMRGTFELPDGVVQPDPPLPTEVIAEVVILGGDLITLEDTDLFDEPGTYVDDSLTFGSIERTFQYYVPSSYDGTQPMPLVVNLHGAGSYGLGQLFYTEFDRVAEEEGFIVVAPDYGLSAKGLFLTPNISTFTSAIIDHLSSQYEIDQRRVYATGISQGGGASLSLAYNLSDRIAAVAPVAAGLGAVLQNDLPRPMSFVVVYGTQDSGWSPTFFDATARLAEQLGASPTAETETWPATPDDPTSITRHSHTGGIYGTEVAFYQVHEGGHTWPGKYQYASLITVGLTSQHIDATEAIWGHLRQHSLPMESPVDILPDALNPARPGAMPVAVLSTGELDATTVEVDTVRFGPDEARAVGRAVEDVDGDGRADVVLRFRMGETGIAPGDTAATLTGRASTGGAFFGSDSFLAVPG